MTQIATEADPDASARRIGRARVLLLAAAAGFIAIVVVFSGLASSQWEASALVGADSFEINRARIPRTAAGLVRDSRLTIDTDATVQPIEETGLVLVRVVDGDRARAEEDLDTLVAVVLEDLNAVGESVGSFVQVTDAAVLPKTVGLELSQLLFFLTLATVAFALAGFGVVSWVADDPGEWTEDASS